MEIVTGYNQDDDVVETVDETFLKNEINDVDDLDSGIEGETSFQFGDGSCAYNVSNNLFEIIEND
jgi:hypothetical protein